MEEQEKQPTSVQGAFLKEMEGIPVKLEVVKSKLGMSLATNTALGKTSENLLLKATIRELEEALTQKNPYIQWWLSVESLVNAGEPGTAQEVIQLGFTETCSIGMENQPEFVDWVANYIFSHTSLEELETGTVYDIRAMTDVNNYRLTGKKVSEKVERFFRFITIKKQYFGDSAIKTEAEALFIHEMEFRVFERLSTLFRESGLYPVIDGFTKTARFSPSLFGAIKDTSNIEREGLQYILKKYGLQRETLCSSGLDIVIKPIPIVTCPVRYDKNIHDVRFPFGVLEWKDYAVILVKLGLPPVQLISGKTRMFDGWVSEKSPERPEQNTREHIPKIKSTPAEVYADIAPYGIKKRTPTHEEVRHKLKLEEERNHYIKSRWKGSNRKHGNK